MVDMLKEIFKTFGKKPKELEAILAKHLSLGTPPQLHGKPQAFPVYTITINEVNPHSGSFKRPLRSDADWATFNAFLKINTPVFTPKINEAGDKLVEALRLKEKREKEESEAKHKKMIEDRAKSFYNIKIQWRSRHYFKDVYAKIRNLSPTQRERLEKQIRANEHPARYSPEDIDTLLIFLESLKR